MARDRRPPDSPRSEAGAADLCARAVAHARTGAYPAPDRLGLVARAAEIADDVAPTLGRQLFDQAVDVATGINDDVARLLVLHADLADRGTIDAGDRPSVAVRLVRATEAVAPYVTDADVVPYRVNRSRCRVSRRRNHARGGQSLGRRGQNPAHTDLPAALLGSVNGGSLPSAQALALDHLIEDDEVRLGYVLEVIGGLRSRGCAGTAAARVALCRAADSIRRDITASAQPALANRLLEWALDRGLEGHVRATLATRSPGSVA